MRLGSNMLEYIYGLNVAWNVGFVCKVSIIGIFMQCQVPVDPFPVPCIIEYFFRNLNELNFAGCSINFFFWHY